MMLRAANLVSDRREGTTIYYRLRDPQLAEMLSSGRQALGSDDAELSFDLALPEGAVPGCPCPRCQEP